MIIRKKPRMQTGNNRVRQLLTKNGLAENKIRKLKKLCRIKLTPE